MSVPGLPGLLRMELEARMTGTRAEREWEDAVSARERVNTAPPGTVSGAERRLASERVHDAGTALVAERTRARLIKECR